MAPMIDMVFLLLVFFMCVSTLADAERAKELELAESERSKVPEDLSDRGIVSVDSKGIIYLGERPVDPDELVVSVKALMGRKPDLRMVVRADKATPYREIRKTLKTLAEAGVSEVVYATFEKGA